MPRSANPIFSVDVSQMTEEGLEHHFEQCLLQHDWQYQYSDDHAYWMHGSQERGYIVILANKIGPKAVVRYNDLRRSKKC